MGVLKVKVISLPYIFQVLYALCFTRPRYQVSVYRTIGPLVCSSLVIFELETYKSHFMYTIHIMAGSCICGEFGRIMLLTRICNFGKLHIRHFETHIFT